jgi:hypothetical protein
LKQPSGWKEKPRTLYFTLKEMSQAKKTDWFVMVMFSIILPLQPHHFLSHCVFCSVTTSHLSLPSAASPLPVSLCLLQPHHFLSLSAFCSLTTSCIPLSCTKLYLSTLPLLAPLSTQSIVIHSQTTHLHPNEYPNQHNLGCQPTLTCCCYSRRPENKSQ